MVESDAKPPATSGGSLSKKKWIKKNKHPDYKSSPAPIQPTKFQGGIDELEGNYFDCTGYGQADRFVKTVAKIADLVGRNYKSGGNTRSEVMTQASVPINTAPVRPVADYYLA